MCRLVAGASTGRRGSELLARLLELLVRSAESDPRLEATGRGSRHCDGFGAYAVALVGGAHVRVYERFDAADTLRTPEEACRANLELARDRLGALARLLERADAAYVVAHARLAGDRPRGTRFAQPLVHEVAGRFGRTAVVVAHNGRFDVSSLSMVVGVDPLSYSDTEAFTVWLARQLGFGVRVEDALREGFGYAVTGYNLAVLLDGPRGVELYGVSGVGPQVPRDREHIEYYRHVVARGEGLVAFVSSTVRDYAEERGLPLSFEDAFNRVVRVAPEGPSFVASLG